VPCLPVHATCMSAARCLLTRTPLCSQNNASFNCMQDYIAVDPGNVINGVCKAQCVGGTNCYLHLHGASSWVRGTFERPSVYAAQSAPGLVMASGAITSTVECKALHPGVVSCRAGRIGAEVLLCLPRQQGTQLTALGAATLLTISIAVSTVC
jgi:hypothetical protein